MTSSKLSNQSYQASKRSSRNSKDKKRTSKPIDDTCPTQEQIRQILNEIDESILNSARRKTNQNQDDKIDLANDLGEMPGTESVPMEHSTYGKKKSAIKQPRDKGDSGK